MSGTKQTQTIDITQNENNVKYVFDAPVPVSSGGVISLNIQADLQFLSFDPNNDVGTAVSNIFVSIINPYKGTDTEVLTEPIAEVFVSNLENTSLQQGTLYNSILGDYNPLTVDLDFFSGFGGQFAFTGTVSATYYDLFTDDSDSVDFNNLNADQLQSVNYGASLFNSLAGNDTIYLPTKSAASNLGGSTGVAYDFSDPFTLGDGNDTLYTSNAATEIALGTGTDTIDLGTGEITLDFAASGTLELVSQQPDTQSTVVFDAVGSQDYIVVGQGGSFVVTTPTLQMDGALLVTDSSVVEFSALFVGVYADGTLTVASGGTVTASEFVAGDATTGNGVIEVTGSESEINVGEIFVANEGSGKLTVSDNAVVDDKGGLYIGPYGSIAIQSGGTIDAGGSILVGNGSGAGATGANITIGAGSTLALTVPLNPDYYSLEIGIGSSAAVVVDGVGALLTTDDNPTEVGYTSAGTLAVEGGASAIFGVSSDASGAAAGLSVGKSATGDITVTGVGSTLRVDGEAYFARAGTASLTVSDSGTFVAGDSENGLYIGDGTSSGTGGTATANVTSDGYIESTANLYVGLGGVTGTLNISGGGKAKAVDRVEVGTTNTINGAAVSGTGTINIGPNGTLIAEGADIVDSATSAMLVGSGSGSTAAVDVSGAGAVLDVDGYVGVGNTATGTIDVSDGGTVNAEEPYAGDPGATYLGSSGGTGSLTVDGSLSTYIAVGAMIVGDGGVGNVTVQNDGSLLTGNSQIVPRVGFVVGSEGASVSMATVTGTGSEIINVGQFVVGGSGQSGLPTGSVGTMLVADGGLVQTRLAASVSTGAAADIAADPGTAGSTVTVTGTNSTWQVGGTLLVGDNAAGTLTITSGGTVSAGEIDAGVQATGAGDIILSGSGSQVNVSGQATIGDSGSATLSIGSGASFEAGSLQVGRSGSISLLGGVLDPPTTMTNFGTIGGYGTLDANIENSGTLVASGGTLEITGSITGTSGSLFISNASDLQLDGPIGGGQTIYFAGTSDTLTLGNLDNFAAEVENFGPGNTIDISGMSVTEAEYNGDGGLVLLSIGPGQTAATVLGTLAVNDTLYSDEFFTISDGNGGTDIIALAPNPVTQTQTLSTSSADNTIDKWILNSTIKEILNELKTNGSSDLVKQIGVDISAAASVLGSVINFMTSFYQGLNIGNLINQFATEIQTGQDPTVTGYKLATAVGLAVGSILGAELELGAVATALLVYVAEGTAAETYSILNNEVDDLITTYFDQQTGQILSNGNTLSITSPTANLLLNVKVSNGGTVSAPSAVATGELYAGNGTLTVQSTGIVDISGSLDVGTDAAGMVTVDTGGTLIADQLDLGVQTGSSGIINLNSGSQLDVGGQATVGDSGAATLTIGNGATLEAGSLTVGADGTLTLSGGFLDPPNINNIGNIAGFGTIDATVNNFGTLTAVGGTEEITGDIVGDGGYLVVDAVGELQIDGGVSSGQTLSFVGGSGTLIIEQPGSFAGTITNFASGDLIDGIGATSGTVAGNVVTLFSGSSQLGTLTLSNAAPDVTVIGGSSEAVIAVGTGSASTTSADVSVSTIAGGFQYNSTSQNDVISTAASQNNLVFLGAGDDTVYSAGADTLVGGSGVATISATGNAVAFTGGPLTFINGSGTSIVVLGGTGSINGGRGTVQVWGGSATLVAAGGTSGNNVLVAGSGNATLIGGGSGDIFVGGSAGSTDAVSTTGSISAVFAGAASMTVSDNSGLQYFIGGSGADTINQSGGSEDLFLGSGNVVLNEAAGSGTDIIALFLGGAGGSITVNGFTVGKDILYLGGYGTNAIANAVASEAVTSAGTSFTLSDGSMITLSGINNAGSNVFYPSGG